MQESILRFSQPKAPWREIHMDELFIHTLEIENGQTNNRKKKTSLVIVRHFETSTLEATLDIEAFVDF